MNATVDLSNGCTDHWVPTQLQCEEWLNCGLQVAGQNKHCSVSLSFVDATNSQALNRDYRGKDKATNVLSFPADFPPALQDQVAGYPLGDIVICAEVVEREAAEQDKDLATHWAHLTVHGLFHLLGYQHNTASRAEEMEQLEINTLERLGIPNPYLVV
ncbi:MAG: rRNA maturation RNase YbeY [Pseudohongiellaceae bacterium]